MLITITIILLSLKAFCPVENVLYIERLPQINPYERIYEATGYVESRFDDNAIGDKHLKQHSYGRVQVRQTRLNDYARQTGKKYNVTFMFVEEYSREVFFWYASQYDYRDIEAISRAWNAGPNWKKVKASEKYYLRVKKVLLSL